MLNCNLECKVDKRGGRDGESGTAEREVEVERSCGLPLYSALGVEAAITLGKQIKCHSLYTLSSAKKKEMQYRKKKKKKKENRKGMKRKTLTTS